MGIFGLRMAQDSMLKTSASCDPILKLDTHQVRLTESAASKSASGTHHLTKGYPAERAREKVKSHCAPKNASPRSPYHLGHRTAARPFAYRNLQEPEVVVLVLLSRKATAKTNSFRKLLGERMARMETKIEFVPRAPD